jgi:DNA-binding FrmR family transcriptional regulator
MAEKKDAYNRDGGVKPHVHGGISDGHTHNHESHRHSHTHSHTHTQTKAVINRLSRAIGHLESVKRMVEDGRDCSEVLIQLAAVKAALTNTGKVILKDHIEHCIIDAVETGDFDAIEELNKAIDRFMG